MAENKRLLLDIVNHFADNPFTEEFLGIQQKNWKLFLQANFPDPATGQWLDIERGDFFEKIRDVLLLRQEAELTSNIPPDLAFLVEKWEKHKSEKTKAIKLSLAQEIERARKTVTAQWEIKKQESLINSDIDPQLNTLRRKVGQQIELLAASYPQLADTTEEISQALAKIKLEELNQALTDNNLPEKIIQPVIAQALIKKKGLGEKVAGKISAEVTQELISEPSLPRNFSKQAYLISLKDSLKTRKEYLEERALNPDFEPTETEKLEKIFYPQQAALEQTREFVKNALEPVKASLIEKLDLSETQVNQLIEEVNFFTAQASFLSQDPIWATFSDVKFQKRLTDLLKNNFQYHLLRPAMTSTLSAIRNAIPGLRSSKVIAAKSIINQITPVLENLPVELLTAAKAATLTNYGTNEGSIEAGKPIGMIPSYIFQFISGRLPDEIVLKQTPDQFIPWFQNFWQENYHTTKKFSQSQRTAIKTYVQFLQNFQKVNPAGFRLFGLYQRNFINIAWGKAIAGYFIKYPDYILHFPYIFGKFALETKIAQWWEWIGKPKVLDYFVKGKVPIIGNLFGFWYKKDEWGIYQGPIKRLKSDIQKFILQKGVRGTGRLLWKIGKKLGIDKLKEWGVKIFASGMTGGIGTLFFAFYPFFKNALKKILSVFGLGFLFLLSKAAAYGISGLIGFGAGTIGGGILGFKVGALVFGATVPVLGPFAIIPAVISGGLTWLVGMSLGTGLGILIKKVLSGVFGQVTSLIGPGAISTAGTATGLGGLTSLSLTANALVAPAALVGIGTLAAGTLIITSSAFIIPVEGGKQYGSKYIQIQKGFDIDGQAQNRLEFQNEEIIGKTLNYSLKVTVIEQPLHQIKVNDKLEIIKDNSFVYREESWDLGDLEADGEWTKNYAIHPDEKFKDAYISNTVTVTTAEGETQTLTLTLTVGQPPLPESVFLARKMVDTLKTCPGLTVQDNGVVVSRNSWLTAKACLEKASLPLVSIEALERFTQSGFTYLQCAHFVWAATKKDLPLKNASQYCTQTTAGYSLLTDWDNIQPGDMIASQLGLGHVALVSKPPTKNSQGELLYLEVAEAIGTNGVVQYRYPIDKNTLMIRYCGFLRKGS